MSTRDTEKMSYDFTEMHNVNVSIGKIEENSQVTVRETGWTEEEKERMKQFGYDALDMVRAWYS